MDDANWPALPLEAWEPTRSTLHMWTQVVGKVRLELSPHVNHWWQVPLYVSARGLTTSAIPFKGRIFEVEFDFIGHLLRITVSDGSTRTLRLVPPIRCRLPCRVHGGPRQPRHRGQDLDHAGGDPRSHRL